MRGVVVDAVLGDAKRRFSPSGSPVFGFTSNRGKLLLETSTRIRWPRRNTSDVGYISIVNSYGWPGVSGFSATSDSR